MVPSNRGPTRVFLGLYYFRSVEILFYDDLDVRRFVILYSMVVARDLGLQWVNNMLMFIKGTRFEPSLSIVTVFG